MAGVPENNIYCRYLWFSCYFLTSFVRISSSSPIIVSENKTNCILSFCKIFISILNINEMKHNLKNRIYSAAACSEHWKINRNIFQSCVNLISSRVYIRMGNRYPISIFELEVVPTWPFYHEKIRVFSVTLKIKLISKKYPIYSAHLVIFPIKQKLYHGVTGNLRTRSSTPKLGGVRTESHSHSATSRISCPWGARLVPRTSAETGSGDSRCPGGACVLDILLHLWIKFIE